jgi:hypothetical protein
MVIIMYKKKVFCFSMLLFGICILLYGLNDKLTALAYPPESLEKSSIRTFEFLDEYEYTIKEVSGLSLNDIMKIQKDDTFSSYEIDGYKNVRTNELMIDCMEAIDMASLFDGNSAICIDYKGQYFGVELKENDIGLEDESGDYIKIGVISFYSTKKEPYFRISNEEASIGIGTKNISMPSKVYELTPVEVSEFSVYSYVKQVNNNYIEGSIIIMGEKIKGSLIEKISLKALNLQEEHVNSIKGKNTEYSTLEIVKNYVFKIPLNTTIKDEKFIFDLNQEGYNTLINVELPLRFQVRVNHE